MTGGGSGTAVPAGSGSTPPWVLVLAGALVVGTLVLCGLLIRLIRLRSQGAEVVVPGRAPVVLTAYTTTIGRAAGNGIQLDDPEVSARHAEIHFSGGEFRIRDLGSRNGVRVNGQKVLDHTLRNGDEMVVGATTLRFSAERPS